MKNKLSKNIVDNYNPEKITRYSIRKASFGATSVAVAAFFMYLGQGTAAASDTNIQDQVNKISSVDENKNNITENTVEKTSKETVVKSETNTLDKTKLSSLIAEIESKIVSGAYDSKTEDSVVKLRVELGTVKTILENAKTQEELTRAYNKLITATTQLKTKPEEKKEVPAVDTTNGKATVGIKATNTEKSSESNSIANSGSKDERNGKALNTNNPFRTDAATTDIDPAANQTYTAPAADADLNTLVKTLLALDPTVENNTRLSQNMDSLGDSKQVAKGAVKEINEFGGWTAVDGGVFAIARRTEEGVYPLETINSTLDDTVWLQEQAFDRDTEYTLLLSKSRTRSNRDEVVYDNSTYKPTGEGGGITKNLVRYKGIEKTFTAYSTKEGSDVIVKFKPGYVGDSEGSKANYKVQVYSITGNQESLVYETTFDPSRNINDGKQIVTAAKDGTNKAKIKISDAGKGGVRFDPNTGVDNTERPNFIGKREAEKLMAQPGNKPNGTAGTFTSKPIALPKGADHYKVRISLADQNRTGMSYQAWDDKYSVPVTGDDFSIAQDTSNVARNLLQRIYDKLKATESADKNGKTSQTIQDYEAELEKVKTLLANPAARTPNFKQALQDLLAKQLGLKTDKTGLTNSKAELDALVNEDPTPGKTTDTAKAFNIAKEAAKTEIAAALTVINDENATPEQVSVALEKVNAKKTALQQAKDGLIVAATAEEKAKLKSDADSLVKADTTGKTPNSIEAYNTKYEAIKAQLEAAKTEAAAVLAKENNASKAEVQAAQTKVDAAKAELTKAAELLVNKADKIELTNAKEALNTLVTETDPTTGKTADSAKAYNDAKTAAQEAIQEAETVINDENATPERVSAALEKVNAKKAALQQAKDGLIEAATAEEKAKLKADAASLVKAETTGKTPNSIEAYNRKYEELKAQLEAAKTEAAAVLAKENNASKTEAQAAQTKVDAVKTELENAKNLLVEAATAEEKTKLKTDSEALKKAETTGKTPNSIKAYETEYEKLKAQLEEAKAAAVAVEAKGDNATKAEAQEAQEKVDAAKKALEKAAELLKDKEDKTELTKAKEALSTLVSEADPTAGKTADSAKSYNDAKTAAEEAIKAAETVINDENATHDQVTEALNKVNEKKAALEAAKQALVEAATAEEKAKLKADADSLVKADTTGKTPNSIAAYNTKYEALKAQLEAAKTEAAKVLAKENNASKAEAQAAQVKVDAAKAELTKAAELLVNKADKTELTKAKEALNTLVTEADPTTGKTADSAKAYNDAKTAAIEAIKAAEMVINDENATQEQVTEALNKVNEKKAELEAAKQALVTAATAEEKAKLKADADLLTKADETGKTPDSIAAYERKYEELKAQLEAAKTEAAAVLAKGNNATKEEVKAAQAKVDAVKTELENAKNLLVEAATTEEKNKLKSDADSLVKVDTTGKTVDSIKAYESEFEKLKAQLEAAKTEATAVLAKGNNATKAEVQAAQAKVDAAKTALDKAAESLKDLDREVAKKEIADAAKKATDAIESSTSLTPEQKTEEKAKVAKEAKDAIDAIDKATTEEGINSAKENGKLAIEKEAAITAIKAEKAAKEQEIDNNTKLSDEEKAAAKAEVAKAATEAVEAITKADTKDAVEAAKTKGETAIKAVTPVGKVKALDAIQKAAEEKIAEIDKNDKLSAEEKAEAKAEVAKAAIKAVTAIQEAKDQATVNTAEETGVKAIKAVTPVGKAKALDAIQKATEEKIAEIDKNDKLSAEEKAEAKAEVAKAATEAVEAIQKAETQDAVDAAQAKGETAIKAVNPIGKALNGQPTNKDALTKATTTEAEATKGSPAYYNADEAKKAAYDKALEEAKKVLAKANATQAEVDVALKALEEAKAALNGVETYKINPTINEVEEFDLSKLLVKGIVVVKKGQDLTEKDIRSKLNLPDGVNIVEIEYPNTNTLGKKVAKVTFRGNDGNLFTIEVPIEVVENTTNTDETNNNRYSEGRVLVNKNTEQTNKEGLKASKNTLPNTGTTETNTGLAGLGLGILGALLAATKRRKEK